MFFTLFGTDQEGYVDASLSSVVDFTCHYFVITLSEWFSIECRER